MYRFFVAPALLQQSPVTLAGDTAHQIGYVLRLTPGQQIALLDGSGLVYCAEIVGMRRDAVQVRLLDSGPALGEPEVHLTLYQAVLKGERFNWVLQKGTEAGISRFVPMICGRSVIADRRDVEQKWERWTRIIREAAEQSRRGRLPELAPCASFEAAVRDGAQVDGAEMTRVMPWEGERALGLRAVLSRCNLGRGSRIQVYVGPEGGFTEGEVRLASGGGIEPVSLGPRILRAETAGLVVAAAVMYESGDLEPGKQ